MGDFNLFYATEPVEGISLGRSFVIWVPVKMACGESCWSSGNGLGSSDGRPIKTRIPVDATWRCHYLNSSQLGAWMLDPPRSIGYYVGKVQRLGLFAAVAWGKSMLLAWWTKFTEGLPRWFNGWAGREVKSLFDSILGEKALARSLSLASLWLISGCCVTRPLLLATYLQVLSWFRQRMCCCWGLLSLCFKAATWNSIVGRWAQQTKG